MKYSQATDYALHSLLYMVAAAPGKPVGVQTLAEKLGVSPTYLSKMMTKLVKAGLIQSAPGANGGYKLRRKPEEISFLAIVHAIEGTASLFECSLGHGGQCLIQQTVMEAERRMEAYLESRNIADLASEMMKMKLEKHGRTNP